MTFGRHGKEIDKTTIIYNSNVKLLGIPLDAYNYVVNGKPAPDGLLAIRSMFPGRKLWYIGDTVDDARSGKAAGVPFIGIAARNNSRYDELIALFKQEGAVAILDDINQLETVLNQ